MAKVAYTIVIERAKKNYSAYAPDLPGCIVTGDTEEEVVRLMSEAIPFHIRGLIEDGEPVPPPQARSRLVETDLAVA